MSDTLVAVAQLAAEGLPCPLTATAPGMRLELAVVPAFLHFAVGDLPISSTRALESQALEDRMVRGGRLLTVELCRGRDLV